MKRHSWDKEIISRFTTSQECIKCGLFRFKWLNMWLYSKEECNDSNPFVEQVENTGCNE